MRLYTITDVAEHLNTTERHIKELVYRRQIPYCKVGRLVRFKPAEIEAWLDATKVAGR